MKEIYIELEAEKHKDFYHPIQHYQDQFQFCKSSNITG